MYIGIDIQCNALLFLDLQAEQGKHEQKGQQKRNYCQTETTGAEGAQKGHENDE